MNHPVTTREEILRRSRELLADQGVPAVNIRSVAAACGVSVGSIYNYFGSKSGLTAAVVESVWREIFPADDTGETDFCAVVRQLFARMEEGSRRYPGFIRLHAAGFREEEKASGTPLMEEMTAGIRRGLLRALEADRSIPAEVFSAAFTREQLAGVVFSAMVSAMVREDYDCTALLGLLGRLFGR